MNSQSSLRTFYILVVTQAFSSMGSLISSLSIGIWIFNETGNATPLALVAFFQIFPKIVAYSFAGVLADRWNRRYVIALSDSGQAIGTLILLGVFFTGTFEIWHLYAVTFIQSIFGVFQGPAFMASIPMLVPKEQLNRANAFTRLSGPMGTIIAPIITGFIYAPLGVIGAITLDLITFLVAVIVILVVYFPSLKSTAEGASRGSFWADFIAGYQFLVRRRSLLYLILIFALVNMMASGLNVLFTPYILSRTGQEQSLGFIMGAASLGSLLGSSIMIIWKGTKMKIFMILPGIGVMGVMMMAIGMAQSTIGIAIAAFLALAAVSLASTPLATIMQTKVPPDMLGRVGSALNQLVTLAQPVAYLMVGPLADQIFEPAVGQPAWDLFAPLFGSTSGSGMGLLIAIGGLGITVVASVALMLPQIRRMEEHLPDYSMTMDEMQSSENSLE